jgi:hypothetical protein
MLSLADCKSCLVLDDELNILPLSSHVQTMPSVSNPEVRKASVHSNRKGSQPAAVVDEEKQLKELRVSLADTQPVGTLISLAKTLDQVCHMGPYALPCHIQYRAGKCTGNISGSGVGEKFEGYCGTYSSKR